MRNGKGKAVTEKRQIRIEDASGGSTKAPSQRELRDDHAEALRMVDALLDDLAVKENRAQLTNIFMRAVELASDSAGRLELKIVENVLRELTQAFKVFAPYNNVKKITIFGSARTAVGDPLYARAREVAQEMAEAGWMVVTGGGPGIMAAATEGAGRERAFGVNIRLPKEQNANVYIEGDSKLVEMRYFFTRKLMLLKESHGFCVFPGGFGTLDELFELLTLVQNGKRHLAPIVLLDERGGEYWQAWESFVKQQLLVQSYIGAEDLNLFRIAANPVETRTEMLGFYRNYSSLRFVGKQLVLRVRRAPADERLEELSAQFADICEGGLVRSRPLPVEEREGDELELERLVTRFDRVRYGRLRELIDALNDSSVVEAVATGAA